MSQNDLDLSHSATVTFYVGKERYYDYRHFSISEASVTIPNIVYVIDCGFVKLRAINPSTGFESLMIVETSRASAMQRAGKT